MTNAIPNPRVRANRANRGAVNRANALLSTGPRTAAGKQRSSQNGRLILLNHSRHIEHVLFHMQPPACAAGSV
jgi:hypothetical protein